MKKIGMICLLGMFLFCGNLGFAQQATKALIAMAERGDTASQLELFSHYIKEGREQSYEEAAKWCLAAAQGAIRMRNII